MSNAPYRFVLKTQLSIIWPFWLNGWMFIYELKGCGFEFSCSHLNFRFRVCFEQRVSWHSGNYKVWIHSETRTWHDRNIQSNAPYKYVLTTQLNHLVSFAKWLSVPLWTKWVWVRVQLQSFSQAYVCSWPCARCNKWCCQFLFIWFITLSIITCPFWNELVSENGISNFKIYFEYINILNKYF